MINRDYILRLAEAIGRELSFILKLRRRDNDEEVLIYIDDVLLRTVGMTSRFLNSLSDEMLVKALSPIDRLNVEAALWIASLLQEEAAIYTARGNSSEGYYRSVKALALYLAASQQEPLEEAPFFQERILNLLQTLADYELPDSVKQQLFAYYERIGHYGKAEDIFFELLEHGKTIALLEQGRAFYQRLQAKNPADLAAGNLNEMEVAEGLAQVEKLL
ncbi:DUF6483 family protein [Tengunoibacter tsumagoiensis]|uniref:Uncharacterized protein n=1 Tax=Tengunoibacter tsumagoiensis TaxID=2014871 RepID=A0A401ZY80_9CHLR|nr:DUF6483 family protein [Tengunoibacter tsumagoiensis]GCE11795.1 hypothetical protein KTT_16540 [Tengunoibacter tsumagoiensis]